MMQAPALLADEDSALQLPVQKLAVVAANW